MARKIDREARASIAAKHKPTPLQKTGRRLDWDAIRPIMGIWADTSIARVYDVPVHKVAEERRKRGIKPFDGIETAHASTHARVNALREMILKALWTSQKSTSAEVTRRVQDQWGTVDQRTIIRHLGALVRGGRVIRHGQHEWDYTYTRALDSLDTRTGQNP